MSPVQLYIAQSELNTYFVCISHQEFSSGHLSATRRMCQLTDCRYNTVDSW